MILRKHIWYTNLSLLFSFIFSFSPAQVPEKQDFNLKEGIYVNHIHLRNNEPFPFTWLIRDKSEELEEYLKNLAFGTNLQYHDKFGIKRDISPQSILGFVINGQLYIFQGGSFNKAHFQGPICFYTAKIEIERDMPSFGTEPFNNATVHQNTEYYYELEQFFLKIETGKSVVATQESFMSLIEDEPTLFNAYKMLQNKQRRTLLFLYLRKYNERHVFETKDQIHNR